jgi:predicted NAD/FAD-dependent oxidoreductase
MSQPRIAIIGAGIAGLACGRALRLQRARVTLFEKSRSLGGRLATRKWEDQVVDHGAPWFSLTDAGLRQDWSRLLPDGLLPMTVPMQDTATGEALVEPEGGRWYLPAGNNRLGKALAEGLKIRMEHVVENPPVAQGNQWRLGDEAYDAVIFTAPWPQTRRLLEPWIPSEEALEPRYRRTLTAFFAYEGDPSGPSAEWSALQHEPGHACLEHSICENHKTTRVPPGRTVIVAHAPAAFSDPHFVDSPDDWAALLEPAVRAAWELSSPPVAVFTHRWGFSTVTQTFATPPSLPRGLLIAGDALTGSSVEAAARSGLHAAHAALRLF